MAVEDVEDVTRFLDDNEDRVYQQGDDEAFSVTTILDRADNGKKHGLEKWKEENDGEGHNADWRHILDYKQNRGTFAHYVCLSQFEDQFDGDQMWDDDEASSLNAIMDATDDTDYLYSITNDKGLTDTYDELFNLHKQTGVELEDLFYNDIDFIKDEFDAFIEDRGLTEEDVEAVEKLFLQPEGEGHEPYGGQADLVYHDPETDETVVADIKTSKRLYDKHKLQVSAYAEATARHPELNGPVVDRAEVIRINPENHESEVHEVDFQKYWGDFAEKTQEAYNA